MVPRSTPGLSVWLLLACSATACGGVSVSKPIPRPPVVVGEGSVPEIHVHENHASALGDWIRAGVEGRILVHLDGNADLDWLPDETLARIAAADAVELSRMQRHPFSMDARPHSGFGNGDFVYPAARLGLIRGMLWVVPDGTLTDPDSFVRFVHERILHRIQNVSLAEGARLRTSGRGLEGTLLGLPVTVVELDGLPVLDEPVLLDVDLDFFAPRTSDGRLPRVAPATVIEALRKRRIRTDVATISFSTMGGRVPVDCRWAARALKEMLDEPGKRPGLSPDELGELGRAEREARWDDAIAVYRRWTRRDPDEPSSWLLLADALRADGQPAEADYALRRARSIDPLLKQRDLYDADRLRLHGRHEDALALYRRYLADAGSVPDFRTYAMRREASCLRMLDRLDEAVSAFEGVLALSPGHPETHFELGLALRRLGRLEDAIQSFARAREAVPDRAVYAMALGTTYLFTGRFRDGVEHLEHAVALGPCWSAARANLAYGLSRVGRYQEAAAHLTAGLASQPRQPRLRELATQLGRRGVEVTPVGTAQPD